jgi:uncharacterized membrane protein YjgN (DUF898 family)
MESGEPPDLPLEPPVSTSGETLEPPIIEAMPAPPPVEPPIPELPKGEPFVFHGSSGEYFRIWIVNLALTLLTLGVYSAWAKVRRRRYFRGNIELMGHRFDYTARAPRLFIGNLVVLVFFLAYALFGAVYPWVRYGTVAVGVLMLPWIVVRSLSFNAQNTVYRGLRFRFHPSLSAATMAYMIKFILVIVTLGLYYPAWSRDTRSFNINGHKYGTAYFRAALTSAEFYGAYLAAGLALVLVFVIIGCAIAVLKDSISLSTLTVALTFGLYLPVLYIGRQYIHARIFNAAWNATRLDNSRFEATMESNRWIALQLTNWAAIIVTLGFLYPWATMRSAHYTASCLRFHPAPDFLATQNLGAAGGSAVGDSAAEFIGLDFGL